MHNKFIIGNLLLHLFLHWLNNFQQSHLPQVGQKIKSESVLEVKNFCRQTFFGPTQNKHPLTQ